MSFNIAGWNCISRLTTAPKPVFYTYNVNLIPSSDSSDTDDTLSTIATSGFFNDVADDIDTNDLVYIIASDAVGIYRFTSANGVTPVTVTAFDFVPAGSIVNADISASAAIAYSKLNLSNSILNADINASAGIVPSKLATAANYNVICIPISFASGAQATHTLYFPMAVTVTQVRTFVTTQLAGTDDGTITCANNAGSAMANGTVTITASSPVATEDNASPTTNNTFTAGQKMQLIASKSTAGGVVNTYVEFHITG